jgi:acetyl/propionyl-CoA carboxylase alpha subunit
MFEKVLIANRGEIALRIIRACKELGVRSVAVYSEADEDSLHVQMADEAICIGPASAANSYLKISNIISAAEIADVDAIHPGYGFLAENAHFAEICANCNITFIGPQPDCIRNMGDKAIARDRMKAAGVPITPGSDGILKDSDAALKLAQQMGYPVLLKAVAGGGGKGMRVARNDVSLVQGFMAASAEGENSFGNPDLFMEKYIEPPETGGGGPVPDADRQGTQGPRRCRRQGRPCGGLRQRRHARVSLRRSREAVLFHGNEHAHPGGAYGFRRSERHRPDEGADPRGRRRKAFVHSG